MFGNFLICEKYEVEIEALKFFKFSSFQLFCIDCNFCMKRIMHHSPYFFFILTLFNIKIIEFGIHHIDHLSAVGADDVDFI